MTSGPRRAAARSSRSLVHRLIASFIRTSATAIRGLPGSVRQRLAELVERAQPGVQRLLQPVLRHPALEPEVGEAGAVGRRRQELFGLVEQRPATRPTSPTRSAASAASSCSSRVSAKWSAQRRRPSRARPLRQYLEGQRKRGLRPRLVRRPPQHLDEPDALVAVGQPLAADADVTGGLEQPGSPSATSRRPMRRCVSRCVLGGQSVPRGLGHPVVAEAVSGRRG